LTNWKLEHDLSNFDKLLGLYLFYNPNSSPKSSSFYLLISVFVLTLLFATYACLDLVIDVYLNFLSYVFLCLVSHSIFISTLFVNL